MDAQRDLDRIGPAALPHHLIAASIASLALALTGCMLAPNDGQVVSSTSSMISFGGYTTASGDLVQVEATNGVSWTSLATTTSGAPPFNYDGTDLFPWSASAVVPSALWRRGTTGSVAEVRARVGAAGANTAYTFLPDWSSCLTSHPAIGDFISHCQSPHSPLAFLYTGDYPTQVDLSVVNIVSAGANGLDVTVSNGGRPGRITQIECSRFGAEIWLGVNAAINPAERQVYRVGLVVSHFQDVSCTVSGVNEDGTPEANTANNRLNRTIP